MTRETGQTPVLRGIWMDGEYGKQARRLFYGEYGLTENMGNRRDACSTGNMDGRRIWETGETPVLRGIRIDEGNRPDACSTGDGLGLFARKTDKLRE
ncbi:MAG: hypothetical protein SXA11_10575 [Cyanobacteriota bacterium]|nr:hypothetical protein [Cyanobacteriota bacterium]